ncbi:M81 family metallopeptidase [Microbacterium sp. SLBN-146]|uniref:M81 family metallopeptidase n=1 Tax=Microbacterium sp. SLBN-146 TaxID=2768457 RepID=UPI001152D3DB|nr:M81 family metallopeptidase [Microbacterium sp. SLBN-146]TQJ29891.1 microcystin degradation protein MlrC [Microbacterium sp. SLBN-146]
MRIGITGFGAESSTFSTSIMRADDFSVHRGRRQLDLYDLAGWFPDADDIEWLPTVRAHGGAGGPVDPDAFDAFADEIVERLTAIVPLEGLYIDLHGAAHIDGRDGAEEELLRRIRAVVGDDTVISMSMDTHGNFSRELAESVDLAVCFRHAPHIDSGEIRERAVRKLVDVLRDGRRPHRAWVRVPVLLPGERTSTVVEPGRSVFGGLIPAIERHGVVDASLWVGFAWADEDRNAAAVMVTAYEADAALACAREIAQSYWDARHGFTIVAENHGSWSEALDFALAGAPAPLFISDSGDNVTAGSAGDITYALTQTLDRPDVVASGRRFLFAGIVDPASVDAAVTAGVGATLARGIGALLDDRFAGPVEREWVVERLVPGVVEGEGVVGAVLAAGDIHAMVQRGRSYFMDPKVFAAVTSRSSLTNHAYIPSDGYDVVVVKVGYLFPGQTDEAASWFMALTPGGTDLDTDRLSFDRVWRPIFPLDDGFEPDLAPLLLPAR